MRDKLNTTLLSKDMKITIPEEEIRTFCWMKQEKAISIEIINHLLGGPNMDYDAINIEDSFQCFQYTAKYVMNELKENKKEILFFENRKKTQSDVIVICTKQNKAKGVREHVELLAIIRLTINTTPVIGFFRFLHLKGQ